MEPFKRSDAPSPSPGLQQYQQQQSSSSSSTPASSTPRAQQQRSTRSPFSTDTIISPNNPDLSRAQAAFRRAQEAIMSDPNDPKHEEFRRAQHDRIVADPTHPLHDMFRRGQQHLVLGHRPTSAAAPASAPAQPVDAAAARQTIFNKILKDMQAENAGLKEELEAEKKKNAELEAKIAEMEREMGGKKRKVSGEGVEVENMETE